MSKIKNDILKNKKIAFFEPHSDFSTNPTLLSISENLLNLGANVDVFCPRVGRYPKICDRITQYLFPYQFNIWGFDIRSTLRNWKKFLTNFSWQTMSILRKKRYDLVFGIDSEGIITAWQFAKHFSVPLIYISFEIFFRDELNSLSEHKEKDKELIASQFAELVIIQDKWRASLLAKENSLLEDKFVYLPVAPEDIEIAKGNYLRDKFNISKDKTIVLHSGSFEDWTCAEELIESLSKWPPQVVFFIHATSGAPRKNSYINLLRRKNLSNVIVSTKLLESKEYESIVASADVGLVLYKQVSNNKNRRYTQKNIKTIGLSSGKFSYYMKYGLPVITFNQDSYAKLLKHYDFGFNIHEFTEMPKAINKILLDYDFYSSEAKRLFDEKLKFNLHWPNLLNKLINIL